MTPRSQKATQKTRPASGSQRRSGFIAALDTGVFCQARCTRADRESGRTFHSARDALAAGFRPCKRCRPLHAALRDPDWLGPLLNAVESGAEHRWHDQGVADLGVDPALVRRWFVTHYGMTFHAWARLRRLGRALQGMQSGSAAGTAIAACGYASESDFREAFALFFGGPPNAVDRESSVWLDRARTPLGSMVMGVGNQGLCLLEFAERRMLDTRLCQLREEFGRVFLPGKHRLMRRVQKELDAYFEGRLREFTVPLVASGTAFQEQVWQALLEIPYGQMRSYGDIAHALNQPEAVRAVGGAIGDNRIAIVIPCHRVVGSGGALVGYGGGLWRKSYLLALEQSEAFTLA